MRKHVKHAQSYSNQDYLFFVAVVLVVFVLFLYFFFSQAANHVRMNYFGLKGDVGGVWGSIGFYFSPAFRSSLLHSITHLLNVS